MPTIMVSLAYGTPVNFKEIYTEGTTALTLPDIAYAKERPGSPSSCWRSPSFLMEKILKRACIPIMVPSVSQIAKVDGVYNAIQLAGDVEDVVLYGRGAGSMPTGSAVVSDVMSIARDMLKNATGRAVASYHQPDQRWAIADATDGGNHLAVLHPFHGSGPAGRAVQDCRGVGALWDQHSYCSRDARKGRLCPPSS
ncbi:MAG: hypothetical protein R3B08_00305 [Nitrospira sp.]